MTKLDLQKELKEKIKPGVKASDLKKLKRSKSEGDIPKAPPLPTTVPLQHSQSQSQIPLTQPSKEEQITNLKEQVKFHAETAQNYLRSLQTSQSKVSELEEKLKNNPPATTELDQNLFARHQNLKSWFSQYSKSKQLDKELEENIDEASNELENQDKQISVLRSEVRKLQQTNQSLQKDLDLAQRLAHSRKVPFLSPEPYPFLRYALYSLVVAVFTLWLVNSFKN